MSSDLSSATEWMKIVDDIEEKIYTSREDLYSDERISVLLQKPSHILTVLPSLTGVPSFTSSDEFTDHGIRDIPLSIGYSDTVTVELSFGDADHKLPFTALDGLEIDKKILKTALSNGVLSFGSDQKTPLKIDNAGDALHLIMRLYDDIPDDLCQSVKSIRAQGPFTPIRSMEVIMNGEHGKDGYDAVVVTVSAGDAGAKNVTSLLKKAKSPVVIPLLIVDDGFISGSDSKSAVTELISDCVKKLEEHIESVSDVRTYPPLVVHRTWYLQQTEKLSSEYDSFSLLWNTVRNAGLPSVIDRRLNVLTDHVLVKPVSIVGILRQKKHLEMLKSLPEFTFQFPDAREFYDIREKAIDMYSVVSPPAEETEIIPEETPETTESEPESAEEIAVEEQVPEEEAEAVSKELIESALGFLEELISMSFCKGEKHELRQIAEHATQAEVEWDSHRLGSMVTDISDLMHNALKRLEENNSVLQSASESYKRRLALIKTQNNPYTPEDIEQITFFWKEFVPLSFKNIKMKAPAEEIKKICSQLQHEFLDYVALTAPDEKEFNKSLMNKWPSLVKKVMKTINNLLDETAHIWELKVKDEVTKLEAFRKKNLPKEPPIPLKISFNNIRKPVIGESLDVRIKKPGLIKMFVPQSDLEKWRDENVTKISQVAGDTIKKYKTDVLTWLKTLEETINSFLQEIKTKGEDSLAAMSEQQIYYEKLSEEAEMMKQDSLIVGKNIDTLNKQMKRYQAVEQRWKDIISELT